MEKRIFHSDKILRHPRRLESWMKGENPYPITVELDMTNRCDHNCPVCTGTKDEDKRDTMDEGLAENIIYELSTLGVKAITFTGGGEPLLAMHTPGMVLLANTKGMDVGFITNGTLLNEEISVILVRYCTWIRISLDAGSSAVYNLTHGVGEDIWFQTRDKIKQLVKIKKQEGTDVTIGIGFLTNESVAGDMVMATEIAKNLGVDYIQFRPYHYDTFNIFHCDYFSRCKKFESEKFKVLCSYNKYEDIKTRNEGKVPFHVYRDRGYDKCYGHNFTTVIGADAKVYICCHARGVKKYCIGDLKNATFWAIWNSDERKKVIENIDFEDCPPFCRCDPFNKILWQLKKEKEHINFL